MFEGKISKSAVFKNNHYKHFGIHESTASLYGDKPEEIVTVYLSVANDQTKPDKLDTSNDADYWGWWDYKKNDLTLIFPKYFLLNMCFPYGIKLCEYNNEGKALRLNVSTDDK